MLRSLISPPCKCPADRPRHNAGSCIRHGVPRARSVRICPCCGATDRRPTRRHSGAHANALSIRLSQRLSLCPTEYPYEYQRKCQNDCVPRAPYYAADINENEINKDNILGNNEEEDQEKLLNK